MKRGTQLKMKGTAGWGGARKGAGRPRNTTRVSHCRRKDIKARHPMHITMRLNTLPVSLRSRRMFKIFQTSARRARDHGLRINEFALMGNHLHMIAEVDSAAALGIGMRSFGGCLGKALRRAAGGRGAVFRERYHAHVLKTPGEYERALRYVLLNYARHAGRPPAIDRYSSGAQFYHWRDLVAARVAERLMRSADPEPSLLLAAARTWLGRVGWRRAA